MNYFSTLYEALESEKLLDKWHITKAIGYGETITHVHINDDRKANTYISIYRDERGYYERPIHYDTIMGN